MTRSFMMASFPRSSSLCARVDRSGASIRRRSLLGHLAEPLAGLAPDELPDAGSGDRSRPSGGPS